MSSVGDQCFQCDDLGHITHQCPNIHCFNCDECSHITVDCPDRIPPSGMPAHHRRWNSKTRHHPISTSRHCHHNRYWNSRSRSRSHSHRYCSNSPNNSHRIPDHTTDATTEALCDMATPALTAIAMTHHTQDPLHIEIH